MKVIGFNYSRMKAEKYNSNINQVKIETNVDITSIESLKSSLLNTGDDFLGVDFTYSIHYNPDFAKIELVGTIILSLEPKVAKEIMKEWKDKTISNDFKISILNLILKKANIKSLELEDELNLPPHIHLPSIKKPEEQNKKEE